MQEKYSNKKDSFKIIQFNHSFSQNSLIEFFIPPDFLKIRIFPLDLSRDYVKFLEKHKYEKYKEIENLLDEINFKVIEEFKKAEMNALLLIAELQQKLNNEFRLDIEFHTRRISEKFGL